MTGRDSVQQTQVAQGEVADAAILAAEHELSPHGILVVDGQGRWISFNRRMVDMWGIPEEIARLRSDADALKVVLSKLAYPDVFAARVAYLYEHADEGSHEEIALKDGRTFERDSAPLILADGRTNGRVWFFRDITERIQGAAATSRLAAIVESSRDAIVSTDRNGIVTTWNAGAERLYGYTEAEMIGRSTAITEPADCKGDARKFIEKILSGGDHIDRETVRIRKDGTPVEVSIVLSPIKAEDGSLVAVSAVVRDITARRRAEQAQRVLTRALSMLSGANEEVVRAATEDGLYHRMCQVIVEVGGYRLAWIGLAEDDPGKTVRPVAHEGDDAGYLELARMTWADDEHGRAPTGTAIRDGIQQINRESAKDPRLAPWREQMLKRGYASSIALPLRDRSRVFGALTIYSRNPDSFGPEEVALLARLADDLSYGVVALKARHDREQAARKLERAMEGTVAVVVTALEMRDPYTAGHERRVAAITRAIAEKMGLADEMIRGLHLASMVHDIGKIAIPSEILTKPGRLTRLEYELMKTHVQAGYDILKQVEFPWPIADIVYQHHERLDGSGYPNGLKGNALLLEARIIAVADVVETMASYRPYRPALGLPAALAEIRKGSGRLYDPAVVDACLAVLRSDAARLIGQ